MWREKERGDRKERAGDGGLKEVGLTGACVDLRSSNTIVSRRTCVETLAVLPHPLPPQEQEKLGLAVHAAIVLGAHRAALADGVHSIASCRRETRDRRHKQEVWLVSTTCKAMQSINQSIKFLIKSFYISSGHKCLGLDPKKQGEAQWQGKKTWFRSQKAGRKEKRKNPLEQRLSLRVCNTGTVSMNDNCLW